MRDSSSFLVDLDPNTNNYLLDTLEFITTGDLGFLMGVDWAAAAGLQVGHHSYKEDADTRVKKSQILGLKGVGGSGHRQQYSSLFELTGNYLSWLETQLAARYDYYSDFGSTFNPKLAFKVAATRSLHIRASAGTGFKAPEMPDVYGGEALGYFSVKDHLQCNKAKGQGNEQEACRMRSVPAETRKNPDLKPETSFSYNLGFVLEPLKRLNITMDYFNYTIKDEIFFAIDKALRHEAKGNDPEDYGVEVVRDINGDPDIDQLYAGKDNAGITKVDGFDINLRYGFPTNWGAVAVLGHYIKNFHNKTSVSGR